jgi:hypothetical protein
VVLKPDVSHLRLVSDFFRPFETYVPLKWDLSDLDEKVTRYVHSTSERMDIARRAYATLKEHTREWAFLKSTGPLWRLLGLIPDAKRAAA